MERYINKEEAKGMTSTNNVALLIGTTDGWTVMERKVELSSLKDVIKDMNEDGIFNRGRLDRIDSYRFKIYYNERELSDLLTDWGNWSIKQFGNEDNPMPTLEHLKEEVEEAMNAPDKDSEYADIIGLAISSYFRTGGNIDSLNKVIEQKLAINKGRTWGKPNELGYTNHIQGILTCDRCGKPANDPNKIVDHKDIKEVGDHCGQYHDPVKKGMFCSGTLIQK